MLLAEALSNKEIASELGVSPSTIKRHLENILSKLHLKNRVEAAIYALKMHGCPLSSKIFHCPLVAWSVKWTPNLGQKNGGLVIGVHDPHLTNQIPMDPVHLVALAQNKDDLKRRLRFIDLQILQVMTAIGFQYSR